MKRIIITLEQCKAARNLLNWKQSDLHKNSGVGMTTIADFERGYRKPIYRTLNELRRTFEEAGIEFTNDEEGCGVKLLK